MKFRTVEDVKESLAAKKRNYEKRIALWKDVEFLTKKNGEPFQALNKNFNNAEIEKQFSNYYIKVHGKVTNDCQIWKKGDSQDIWNKGEWINDEICLYQNNYMSKKYIPENGDILEVAAIKEMIKDHIEKLETYLKETNQQLEKVENILNKYIPLFSQLRNDLIEDCGADNNTLFYNTMEFLTRNTLHYLG